METRTVSRFKFLVLVPLLLLSLFFVTSTLTPVRASTPPALYIDPPSQPTLPQGNTVAIRVSVANMSLFSSWDIRVVTNARALNAAKVDVSGNVLSSYGLDVTELASCVNGSGTGCSIDDAPSDSNTSIVHSVISAKGIFPPAISSISGLLFTITFTAGSGGVTGILLNYYIISISGSRIPYSAYAAVNGIYGNGKLPIVDFTWQPLFPFIGDNVTFKASSSDPNPNGVIATYNWDFREQNQFPTTSTNNVRAHIFKNCSTSCLNPNGNRSFIFPVTLTVADNLTIANSKTAYIIVNSHPIHDLAISDIRASPEPDIPAGSKVRIDVLVFNNGTFTEGSFTVYANVSSLSARLSVKDLGNQTRGGSITVGQTEETFFTWDTSGDPPGTYQIEAWVTPIRNPITGAIEENNTANDVRFHLVSIQEPQGASLIPLSIAGAFGLAAVVVAAVVALRGWMKKANRKRSRFSEKLN